MVDQELKEKMIGRLVNWKFSQATDYVQVFERDDSVKCLELLEKLWGDTGWDRGDDTIFGEIIAMLVDFIRMKEGWTTEEFYDDDEIDVI